MNDSKFVSKVCEVLVNYDSKKNAWQIHLPALIQLGV